MSDKYLNTQATIRGDVVTCFTFVNISFSCVWTIVHNYYHNIGLRIGKLCISNQKQPSCKKRCGPHKGHGEKRCEIQGGGQEMVVMVG